MGPPKKSRYYTIKIHNSGATAFNIVVKKAFNIDVKLFTRLHLLNYRCRLKKSVVRSTVYGDYTPTLYLNSTRITKTYKHERGRILFNSYARRRLV